VEEIAACCAEGDYLRAALLAAGRAFGGAPQVDPRFDALLVSHHVCCESRTPPWPGWCFDPALATGVCQAYPDSVRLAYLAAECHLSQSEGADAVLSEPVAQALLAAFNDSPEVRTWLAAVRDTTAVPGLWEQICRPTPSDPLAEYRERRRAFAERYESGLLHRSDKAAYIHRLDHFLSGQRAFRLLHSQLKPGGPDPLTAEDRALIVAWLGKKPEWITDTWRASTERPTVGKVKLRRNQEAELVRRATEYLDYANRAWRAAQARLSASPPAGDVEKRRQQLRDLLPPARARAEGRTWGPLFRRLAERLHS
jgi:hypothetical protein